jgi:DNA-binding NarL/FixJ family response regulator
MTWIAQGKTNAETATILKLSRRTVDKHLEHIYSKLGVETHDLCRIGLELAPPLSGSDLRTMADLCASPRTYASRGSNWSG